MPLTVLLVAALVVMCRKLLIINIKYCYIIYINFLLLINIKYYCIINIYLSNENTI